LAIRRVQPGDLITSDLINQMIDEINRLGKTVASCEQKRRTTGKPKAPPKRKKGKR